MGAAKRSGHAQFYVFLVAHFRCITRDCITQRVNNRYYKRFHSAGRNKITRSSPPRPHIVHRLDKNKHAILTCLKWVTPFTKFYNFYLAQKEHFKWEELFSHSMTCNTECTGCIAGMGSGKCKSTKFSIAGCENWIQFWKKTLCYKQVLITLIS